MNKRDRLIGVLLILSVLFFQYLWLLLSVLLLVVLGILIFDTRYDRYALVMVVLVLLLYLSAKFMFYETYLVPTKSMLPALNSNVTVRGEKWRYGGIYLSAVEEWPLVTMFTRSSKYRTGKFAAKDQIKMIGFWKPKKNDILAYYAPVDSSRIHIERCIGLPGDVVSVKEGRAVINGKEREEDKTLCLRYMAYFSDYMRFREACKESSLFMNSDDYSISEDAVYMSLDKTMLDRLRQGGVVDSLVFRQRGETRQKVFLADSCGWSFRHWGPYKLPYKGMRIELTRENRMLYGPLLRGPERVADPDKLTSYVFQKDYYSMLGDNRGNSLDSRFLGPIPSCCIEARILHDD